MNLLDEYKNCNLCPNHCGVDRTSNELGICNESDVVRVAFSGLHRGEEPPVTGKKGSGMIFFSGCPLHCKYCQNYQISGGKKTRDGNVGISISIDELSTLMLELEKNGANNINLVTPTHYIPSIVIAIQKARLAGMNLPIVYNTSGYEDIEALKLIDDYIDLYLIDLKTLDKEVAKKFCGREKYVEVITKVFDFLVEKHPRFEFIDDLTTPKGLLVRHLVFPDSIKASLEVLDYFAKYLKDKCFLSLMVQFIDPKNVKTFEKISSEDYDLLLDYLDIKDIENGFVQELGDNIDWIPDFKLDKPFPDDFCDTLDYYLDLKRKRENYGL
ncbi:MAG: radical SAM protein [Pleomorphochaeta sp.]